MYRKWSILISVIFLCLGLTACSNSGDQPVINGDSSVGSEAEGTNNNHAPEQEDEFEEPVDEQEVVENDMTDDSNDDDISILDLIDDLSIVELVNKEYSLADNYSPEDLVPVDVPTVLENPEVNQLRKVAADALKEMFEEAKKSDVYLHARSGYRSYQTQQYLFQGYAEKHGEEAANRFSAKPGHSEHQTGLVMDVTSESVDYRLTEKFGETKDGIWLSEHAHEFGFIIRYPKGKENITGYVYEPWHIRYLGVDMATAVYESGLTYEEYLEKEGIAHEVSS